MVFGLRVCNFPTEDEDDGRYRSLFDTSRQTFLFLLLNVLDCNSYDLFSRLFMHGVDQTSVEKIDIVITCYKSKDITNHI